MAHSLQEIDICFSSSPSDSIKIGTLVSQKNRLFFEYTADWLRRGLEFSPFTLLLRPGLHEHTNREFGPLFGLFDDSLPDGWGLLLMDRHFRKIGLDPASISPLHRLVYLGDETMGGLTYHPAIDRLLAAASTLNLHDLSRHAQEIYEGECVDVLPQLLRAGGSPGEARPKVLVGFNPITSEIVSGEDILPEGFEPWLVKFSAREDRQDAGPLEYAYSLMAKEAGIEMTETRLFVTSQGDRFFGAKRFDRAIGNRRRHIHTFGNLIESNFRLPNCDYADFLKATTILTKNHEEVLSVFRLMLFNILTHNRDDHVKNFSFVLEDLSGQWKFAPAYDLILSNGLGGEHATTVAGEGRHPTKQHILRLAEQFDISEKLVDTILNEVTTSISNWRCCAKEAGVSGTTSDKVAGTLDDLGKHFGIDPLKTRRVALASQRFYL